MFKKKKLSFDSIFPYSMCVPALVLFTLFVIYPFLKGFWISFNRWNGLSDMQWIGLKNYRFVISDSIFWMAMKNTFVYAIVVTIIKNLFGLLLAIIMVRKIVCRTLFRVSVYMPVTFSYVVIGVLWSWIFNPGFGILNNFLSGVGADFLIQGWLSNPKIALFSVAWVDIWKWTGFHMVLYLAGLQGIPKVYYEAAKIDGANAFVRFRHITLPLLNSTLVVNFLLAITGAFVSNYDIVNVMTGGGPFRSTEVALTYTVSTAFKFSALGKANAMSMILFAFVLVFGLFQVKVMTKDDIYN